MTFVNTEYTHFKMVNALGSEDQITHGLGLDLSIRLAQISDGLPLDFDRVAHPAEAFKALNNMGGASEELICRTDPLAWNPRLDSNPKSSVIYVSFGSMVRMPASQVQEIAKGLLESEQFFVWVLRPGIAAATSPDTDLLPESFLKESKDGGLVVPWAPQVLVLSHPSVGGYLTHCGWNSTVESLSSAVATFAFPKWYDQYTNRMLIAKQWKIGMTLKMFRDDGTVEGEEIGKAVRALMESEEGEVMRRRATVLSHTAREALSEGGSSSRNLLSFVDFIAVNRRKKAAPDH